MPCPLCHVTCPPTSHHHLHPTHLNITPSPPPSPTHISHHTVPPPPPPPHTHTHTHTHTHLTSHHHLYPSCHILSSSRFHITPSSPLTFPHPTLTSSQSSHHLLPSPPSSLLPSQYPLLERRQPRSLQDVPPEHRLPHTPRGCQGNPLHLPPEPGP